MGKCCSTTKTLPPPPVHKSAPVYIIFKSPQFSVKFPYRASKSLSSYLSQLVLAKPELASKSIQVAKAQEILQNVHFTVKDLQILPNDTLFVEFAKPVKSENSVTSEEIAEEESTTKMQALHAKLKARTESTGEAVSLWMSAMPSPTRVRMNERLSESSSVNQLDLTLEQKVPPKLRGCEVKGGMSVILDSDDSFLKNETGKDSLGRHPYDFFKDLQGPFSVLKSL